MASIKILIIFFSCSLTLIVSGQKTCSYKLDTASILSNNNLDDFLAVLQNDSFIVTNNKKDIPRFIKKALGCLTDRFSIANPGKPFQATDLVLTRINRLPTRQLVFLSKSKNMLVMTYWKGGRGKSGHILFVKFNGKKIIDLWTGYLFNGMDTKEGIIDNINQNRNKMSGLNTNTISF